MGRAITIRTDLGTAADLRRMAKQQRGRRPVNGPGDSGGSAPHGETAEGATSRPEAPGDCQRPGRDEPGSSRAQAARAVGIERQSLCDAIKRFNAEGFAGLVDRPKGHRRERLSEAEQAVLINLILRGPDPEKGEPCAWTLPDLCRFIEERFDKSMCPQSMSRVVRRLGLSRQKARPVHPQKNAKAAEAFQKRGCSMP